MFVDNYHIIKLVLCRKSGYSHGGVKFSIRLRDAAGESDVEAKPQESVIATILSTAGCIVGSCKR